MVEKSELFLADFKVRLDGLNEPEARGFLILFLFRMLRSKAEHDKQDENPQFDRRSFHTIVTFVGSGISGTETLISGVPVSDAE